MVNLNDATICISMCGCKKIVIADTTDWNFPTDDILHSKFTLTFPDGTTVEEYEDDSYVETYTFESDINYVDGEFEVMVVYSTDIDNHIADEYVYNTCNIKCKKDQLLADIADDSCEECTNAKLNVAFEAFILYQSLCAAIKCNDTETADSLVEWLNNKLINYNCKNC